MVKEFVVQLVIRVDLDTKDHPNEWDWQALLDMPYSHPEFDVGVEGLVDCSVVDEFPPNK